MSETRDSILQLAEMFIRTKGFHAFSYKDISHNLHIKNAAVHYHFPSKTDLGVAVIEETLKNFGELTDKISRMPEDVQLRQFMEIVYAKSHQKGWVCITGALSPVFETLPVPMQEKLKQLTTEISSWLTNCLEHGKAKGIFHFEEKAEVKAKIIISSLLSSLLLSKVLGKEAFLSIYKSVLKGI